MMPDAFRRMPGSQISIDRAISRFPIEEYLRQRGARPVKGRIEWELTCPVCFKTKCIVNAQKRAWHCWVCEREKGVGRGGLLDLMQMLDGVSKSEAVERVLHQFHDAVALGSIQLELVHAIWDGADAPLVEIPLPPHWSQGAVDYGSIKPYCDRRGIAWEDVVRFGLGSCRAGRYAGRLVFPVYREGCLVYWQARAMWERDAHVSGAYVKSLNPPKNTSMEAGSGDVLFNLDQAAQYERVCITEGPIDAIHVGYDAVCSFGKRLTSMQVGELLRAGVRAIDIMFDGPSPTEPRGAYAEMWDVALRLRGIFDVQLCFLPRGDPGDYPREYLRSLRSHYARRLNDTKPKLMEV